MAALERYDARLPTHQRLASVIEGAIRTGELRPGDSLPSESHLAQEFHVALGTVRRAMDTLREGGLIERQQGRGTFVRQPDFTRSMMRFFHFGDGYPGHLPRGSVNELITMQADKRASGLLNIRAGDPLVQMTRVRSVGGNPVAWERIWVAAATFDGLGSVAPADVPDLLYPWYQERFDVIVANAREELVVDSADADDLDPLGCRLGDPVVEIERVARTLTGDPVERRITRGLASAFRYRVEIS